MTNAQKIIKTCAIGFGIFFIVSICGGIVFGLSFLGIYTTEEKTVPNEKIIDIKENINNIAIDISTVNIEIKLGEKLQLKTNLKEDKYGWNIKEGTLEIKEKNKNIFSKNTKGNITLSLPEKIYKNLKINAGAGKIEIKRILVEKLDLDQGVGILKIKDASFHKTNINGGTGSIQIENSKLNNLNLDVGVGEVKINAKITGKSFIDCGIGEVNLLLIGEESDYCIDAQNAFNIQINGKSYKNKIFSNGKNQLTIDDGIGTIKVRFIAE